MLSVKLLNTKVVQHILETLYQDVKDTYGIVILQDRQSAPRPLDEQGNIKNYIYYRVETPRTLQWQSKELVDTDNGHTVQRTISQKQLSVRINFLGTHAVDVANYFDHAINSVLSYTALRPEINGTTIEFQYNGHTEPVDLTEIEQTKWVARVEYEVLFGYVDHADFDIDTFNDVEADVDVTDGVTTKTIIVKTKLGEQDGL